MFSVVTQSFNKLVGNRLPLVENQDGSVEVLVWYHPDYRSTSHAALKIRANKNEYYLSFAPVTSEGVASLSFFQLRKGSKAIFIDNYEDEILIDGFKRLCPEIIMKLDFEQMNRLFSDCKGISKESSIKKIGLALKEMNSLELLNILRLFPETLQSEIKKHGTPSHVVELRTLDTASMISKINSFKTNATQWAAWAGSDFHEDNTHNCASIVLDVLYEGGLGKLITYKNDLFGVEGALLGAGYAFLNNHPFLNIIKYLVTGAFLGKGLGGASEGYNGIQSFLNLINSRGKDTLCHVLGLRILITSLSTFIGTVKPGYSLSSILSTPTEVLKLAREAEETEKSMFSFYISEQMKLA